MEQGFGPALRHRRRAAGLSQRDLAVRTELDFSYISKVENGRLPPPAADTVVAICRVLDIAPEDLLALTGKIPSAVQQTVSSSRAAQQFLREAQADGAHGRGVGTDGPGVALPACRPVRTRAAGPIPFAGGDLAGQGPVPCGAHLSQLSAPAPQVTGAILAAGRAMPGGVEHETMTMTRQG